MQIQQNGGLAQLKIQVVATVDDRLENHNNRLTKNMDLNNNMTS